MRVPGLKKFRYCSQRVAHGRCSQSSVAKFSRKAEYVMKAVTDMKATIKRGWVESSLSEPSIRLSISYLANADANVRGCACVCGGGGVTCEKGVARLATRTASTSAAV